MTTSQIAFYNKSNGAVSDDEIRDLLAALAIQIQRDFLAIWGVNASLVLEPVGAPLPPEHWAFEILENTDDLRFFARHVFDGSPIGRVFAATDQRHGVSWQVCASHELMELLVDPQLNRVALGPKGEVFDMEVCDPVQSDSCGYRINDILVSNFVFPSWFQIDGTPPYDHRGLVKQPFEIFSGGTSNGAAGQARPGLGTRRALRATKQPWAKPISGI